jgi:very-short-patch-repair endonuclease
MGTQDRTVEQKLARIAGRQYGLVTHAQLRAAGVSSRDVVRRAHKGSLIPEYRGIYRVGHRAPSVEATYLAAVLACGKGALLSGRAAAHLFGLVRGPAPPPEVTTPTERRIKGISTRRSRHIDPRDATTFHGIPVTTVPRTLVDLAAVLTSEQLARACHEAGVRYHTTPKHVEAVLARQPNAPGARKLRAVMRGDVHVTLSKLERGFLRLLRDDELELPKTNRRAGGRYVDCRWPDHKLTVELDSYRFHNSRYAWEMDRRREREARARGDEFRRYTYGDVFEDPRYMLRELRELLSRPRNA